MDPLSVNTWALFGWESDLDAQTCHSCHSPQDAINEAGHMHERQALLKGPLSEPRLQLQR